LVIEHIDSVVHTIRFPSDLILSVNLPSIKFLDNSSIYVRFKEFQKQDFSLELSQMNDNIIIDFDKKNRIVGIAFLDLTLLPNSIKNYCHLKQWKSVAVDNNIIFDKIKCLPNTEDFIENKENEEMKNHGNEKNKISIVSLEDSAFHPVENRMKRTSFLQACCFGTLDDVKKYYDLNPDSIEDKDKQGSTAFILSASFGRIEIAKWLLTIKQYQFNESRHNGTTAFIQAALHGHIHFLEFLLEYHDFSFLDIQDNSGDTALLHSSRSGQLGSIKWLIARGSDLFHKSSSSSTCLHRACVNGDIDVIKFLIDSGLDINALAANGSTPLHYAARSSKLLAIKVLLEKRVIICQNNKGFSPLDIAKKKKNTEIIEILEIYLFSLNIHNK